MVLLNVSFFPSVESKLIFYSSQKSVTLSHEQIGRMLRNLKSPAFRFLMDEKHF